MNSNDRFAVNNSWIILVRAGKVKSRLHANDFITDRISDQIYIRIAQFDAKKAIEQADFANRTFTMSPYARDSVAHKRTSISIYCVENVRTIGSRL